MLQLFIVEDNDIMREMLCVLFEETEGFAVCGEAATAEEALEKLAEVGCDVILLDVSLPEMSGIDLVATLASRNDPRSCLMLSGHNDPQYARKALEAGARGYVLKGNPGRIPEAVRKVHESGFFLDEELSHLRDLIPGAESS